VQVRSVPTTLNGKRVEVPVKKVQPAIPQDTLSPPLTEFQIINGASMASVNPATLRNPESLEEYVALGAKLRAEL
jgi:acetoacetyl-CoA synthetase